MRLTLLDHHLQQGDWLPRWIPELFLGYGYPLFNFYGPALYYLAEFLYWVGFVPAQALNLMVCLFVLIGGLGMYQLATDFYADASRNPAHQPTTRWLALVAAIAYIYTPYLITNLYIRGAWAEVGAQALLPWIFWSFRRLLQAEQPQRYAIAATLSLAGLAVTHNITLLLLTPLLLVYLVSKLVDKSWQVTQNQLVTIGVCCATLCAAMGLSAFYWLPLVLERNYLFPVPYSHAIWVENSWRWSNFLNLSWPFHYAGGTPFQLGLTQLCFGGTGILLAYTRRKHRAEWWFWMTVTGIAIAGASQLALPLYDASYLLQTIQFPWRLLTFIGFTLALFSGTPLLLLRTAWSQIGGAILLIVFIIVGNFPSFPAFEFRSFHDFALNREQLARFELDRNALGAGWAKEFLPRWAEHFSLEPNAHAAAASPATIVLSGVTSYSIEATITVSKTSPLRFNQFYFPGWQALLDSTVKLQPYPSTARGLLTVDLPSGTHYLKLFWQGTALQRWANLITLLTLFVGALWLWRQPSLWKGAMIPLVLGLVGVGAWLQPSQPLQPLQKPVQPVEDAGVALLGYYTEQPAAQTLLIYPYWYAHSAPADSTIHWQLADDVGNTYGSITSLPYYNTQHTTTWVPGTLVHDAYLLNLPAGLKAGSYQLQMQLQQLAGQKPTTSPLYTLGKVVIATDIPAAEHQANIQFVSADSAGSTVQNTSRFWLDSAELLINRTQQLNYTVEEQGLPYALAQPGEQLEVVLSWRAQSVTRKDYHSFLHFLNSTRQTVVGQDHIPGSRFNPPHLWNAYVPQRDTFTLRVPSGVASGLYTPRLGLYQYADEQRMNVLGTDGTVLGDAYDLPPIKVVNSPSARPQHKVAASFANLADFLGYDLTPPASALKPGDTFTVTFYYQATTPTTTDYTRFVHLYDPARGMAAQFDSPPQQGANPTSAWVQDEVIADPVVLQIAPDAKSGAYQLQIGLYDASGTRLAVHDSSGLPLPDAQLILTTLEVKQ